MRTMTCLGLVSGVFGFASGLLSGVWGHESDVSAAWGITLLLMLDIVLLASNVLAQWRQVSAPALVGALLGGIMAAALIFGDFFAVAV
ncbi:MAG TPA: hypothetical protein VGR43_08115, partial [Dehalococcoidia bacterium]|nr:hypothetical protein [Dehalococcoidia bacterium]